MTLKDYLTIFTNRRVGVVLLLGFSSGLPLALSGDTLQAWAKNVGWRIDYHVITPGLADKVKAASIYKAQRFSDHAPLTMDYDYTLR